MSGPTFLESRAAYVGKKVGVSGTRILAAMLEWSQLSKEEKATHRLPDYSYWSEDEIATLRELWESGAAPEQVLQALPDRSYAAITNFASSAGIKRPADYLSKCRVPKR